MERESDFSGADVILLISAMTVCVYAEFVYAYSDTIIDVLSAVREFYLQSGSDKFCFNTFCLFLGLGATKRRYSVFRAADLYVDKLVSQITSHW